MISAFFGCEGTVGESWEKNDDTNDLTLTRTAATSFQLNKPSWSAVLSSSYSLIGQEQDLSQQTIALTNTLSIAYRPTGSLTIEPALSFTEEWDKATGLELDTPCKPNFGKPLDVTNKFFDDFGSERNARNEGVQIKSKKLRCALLAFPIEIIELILHDLQQISRCAAGTVSGVVVAARHIIRHDNDFSSLRLDGVGIVGIQRIGPPDKARFSDQL